MPQLSHSEKVRPPRRVIALVCLIALGSTGLFAATALASGPDQPPGPPPWVDPATGIVDMSKMPAQIPVAGPNGEQVGTISRSELTRTLPPMPPKEVSDRVDILMFDQAGQRVITEMRVLPDGRLVEPSTEGESRSNGAQP